MTDTAPLRVVEISSIQALVEDLTASFAADDHLWFRGQARAHWTLLPSLARRGGLDMETELLSEFKRDGTHLIERADVRGGDLSEWDWMFLMQHYRVPTRLMDWTESPLAAAFFALDETDVAETDDDACIWVLKPQELNRLGKLDVTQPWSVPLCGENDDANMYLPSQINVGGRHLEPMAVSAIRRFDRIRAQSGVFTVIHRDAKPLEEIPELGLVKYVIPLAHKPLVGAQLRRLGVHSALMYPDLEHLGRRVSALVT